jgi:hypothetical protein
VFPVRYELFLCVPYGSHSKQRLFPYTALTGWALQRRRYVFPLRYELFKIRTSWYCSSRVFGETSETYKTEDIVF